MLKLNNLLKTDGELTVKGRTFLTWGSIFYILLLCLMCFLPQVPEKGMETPGIQQFGRIVVLLSILGKLRPSFNWSKFLYKI